jgi:hypothetical protein
VTAPSRTAAVAFTALTAVAGLELTYAALYMPWPALTLIPALLAVLAATCAAHEWTALQRQADTDRTPR